MEIPVGPHRYTIQFTDDDLVVRGQSCEGCCDPLRNKITIRRNLPPSRRLAVFWHEVAHAWQVELNITAQSPLTEEAVCNLVALAMAAMTPDEFAQMHAYLLSS